MPVVSRRERIRAETVQEIRGIAARQVDEGGLAALSLNAIAKAMGMSGPALYRYFASREELLAALITDGYADLASAVQAAEPSLDAVAVAYRAWALAHPRRYALLFGERPEGFRDPPEAIAAIQGAMDVVLALLGDRPGVEHLGVIFWTRIHGIVSLELAGVFADMGLDAGVLLAGEVAGITAS